MRICAAYRVWSGSRFLPASIESIYDSVDGILVSICRFPWGHPPTLDRPCERVQETVKTVWELSRARDPKGKIMFPLEDCWDTEDQHNNDLLDQVRHYGFDYMALVDTDEFYNPGVLRVLAERHSRMNEPSCTAVSVLHKMYWKTPQYRLRPDYLWANVLFRCDPDLKMVRKRHPSRGESWRVPFELAACYHLSYVRTDEEVRDKLSSFSHSSEILPGWYENVWKRWDENKGLKGLHPIEASLWSDAIWEPEMYGMPEPATRFV